MLRLLLSCGTPLVFCASLNDTIDIVDGNIRSFTALFSIRYIYTYHLRIKFPVQLDHSQIKVRDLKNVSVDTHNRYNFVNFLYFSVRGISHDLANTQLNCRLVILDSFSHLLDWFSTITTTKRKRVWSLWYASNAAQLLSSFLFRFPDKAIYHPCTVLAKCYESSKPCFNTSHSFLFLSLLAPLVASQWNLSFFQDDNDVPSDLFRTVLIKRPSQKAVLFYFSILVAYRTVSSISLTMKLVATGFVCIK